MDVVFEVVLWALGLAIAGLAGLGLVRLREIWEETFDDSSYK